MNLNELEAPAEIVLHYQLEILVSEQSACREKTKTNTR
jgi:hypothetical protein